MIPLYWLYRLDQRVDKPTVELWGVADDQPDGSNGGFITAGQGYSLEDTLTVKQWLNDRAAGYPSLKKFEGGANWPEFPDAYFGSYSDAQGATWEMRTAHSSLRFGGEFKP